MQATGPGRGDPAFLVYSILRTGFVVAPILFGLDKFFDWTVEWTDYLAGWIDDIAPGSAQDFMYFVGVVEIVAGLVVLVALDRRLPGRRLARGNHRQSAYVRPAAVLGHRPARLRPLSRGALAEHPRERVPPGPAYDGATGLVLRQDPELLHQADLVGLVPVLHDLPVADAPHGDPGDLEVLASRVDPEEVSAVGSVGGDPTDDHVVFGHELLDHVASRRRCREVLKCFLPPVARRRDARERVVLDEVRCEELLDDLGVACAAPGIDCGEITSDQLLALGSRHVRPPWSVRPTRNVTLVFD